ncbi:MAG: isopentenyl phosphate kinase [Methanotrichaceae archaeon]
MIKILKIGGSILTDKTRLECPRENEIDRVAKEIAKDPFSLILIHGAGSFGHIHATEYGLRNKFSPKGILETHKSVAKLNSRVVEALSQAGANPVPVHPLSCTLLKDGRIETMEIRLLQKMVKRKLLPVLHGDVVMDRSKGVDILSGDQLVTYLAKSLNPDVTALGTKEDGVIFRGKTVPKVTRQNYHQIESELGGSKGVDDVTGGMKNKVLELLDLADHGIKSLIFNAGNEDLIERVLRGETVGTVVEASK